ncbi:unnamed protein product, partial [Polarella glacialis]
ENTSIGHSDAGCSAFAGDMRENHRKSASSPPLGRLSATRGTLSALGERFEQLADKAWFTRKLSVLLPVGGLPEEAIQSLASRLQLQRRSYCLDGVPLAALGQRNFAEAVRDR